MSQYTPDRWVIVKFTHETDVIYKVLASWVGGWAGSDAWQLNSGIESFREKDGVAYFEGFSGSEYACHLNSEGMFSLAASVFKNMQDTLAKNGGTCEIVKYSDFISEFNASLAQR